MKVVFSEKLSCHRNLRSASFGIQKIVNVALAGNSLTFITGNNVDVEQQLLQNIYSSVQVQEIDQVLNLKSIGRLVMIFDSDSIAISSLCDAIIQNKFTCNAKFIIILEESSLSNMESIFDVFWKHFFYDVSVVTKAQNSSKASMFTFLPFSGQTCGDTKPIKINEFDEVKLKWTTNIYFPKKFKNLQKCSIRAGAFINPPAIMMNILVDGSKEYEGITYEILRNIALSLNALLEIKIYPVEPGLFFPNKTASGLMKRAYEREVDLIFGILSLQQSRMEFLSETTSLFNGKIILIVPPPELLGPIEELLSPFEFYSWIGILAVLIIACLTISILKFLPRKFHDFIVGRHMKNEFLNIWSILLGVSLKKLPQTTFARYLLMLLIMYSMVMRSVYTGSLFNILKNDKSLKEIKSIQELDSKDFTFYVYESLAVRLQGEEIVKR